MIGVLGHQDRDVRIVVLSLGTPDTWFVWVRKSINLRTTVESDIYLLSEPLEPILRVRHSSNNASYTTNKAIVKGLGHSFIYGSSDPTEAKADQWKAIGRDGKRYPRSIQWDSKRKTFFGPGLLKLSSGGVIFEVNESESKRFVATDAGL
jgi:hypothetical protein